MDVFQRREVVFFRFHLYIKERTADIIKGGHQRGWTSKRVDNKEGGQQRRWTAKRADNLVGGQQRMRTT